MKHALRLVALLISAPAIAAPDAASPDVVGAADLSGLRDVQLDIGALMQFRYTASVAPDSPDPIDDPAIGFSFRRLRTWVDFEAFDGDLRLFIQGDAGSGGNSRIDEAFGGHKIDDNWAVRWGLIRVAFNREMWVSSKRQIAVDRGSLANNLNPGRSDKIHGVELAYEAEPWRFFFTAGEGLDSRWTSFNQAGKSQWSLTLRGETLLVGDNFKQFKRYTAPGGTARGLMLGAAAHVQHTPMGGDRFAYTADLNYQDSGFNAMVMGGGHVAEDRNTPAVGEPESLFGVAGHVGVYVREDVEPFVRYEWGTSSSRTHPDLNVLTAGVNWYVAGQALKFVADASIAFDGVGPAFNRNSDGLLATPAGDHRLVFRAQVQFLF